MGTVELAALSSLVTGKFGLLIGLAATVLGIYTWVVKQSTMVGLTMIVGGILFTLAPGVVNGTRILFCPIVTSLGGTCAVTP